MEDVDEAMGIRVGGKEQAIGLDGPAAYRNAGALELIIFLVEVFRHASFGFHTASGLERAKTIQPALALRKGRMTQE